MHYKKLVLLLFLCTQLSLAAEQKQTKTTYAMLKLQSLKNRLNRLKIRISRFNKKPKALTELNSPSFSVNDQGQLQALFELDGFTIRTITTKDFDFFKKLWTNKELMKYYANGKGDEESATKRFKTSLDRIKNNNPMAWLTICKNNQPIGFMGIGLSSTQEFGTGELIFFISSEEQNKGLGKKITTFATTILGPELKRLGNENLKGFRCFFNAPLYKIFATANYQNKGSIAVLDKANFKPSYIYGTEKIIDENGKERAVKYMHDAERYCFEYILP